MLDEVKKELDKNFIEINSKIESIVQHSRRSSDATEEIMNYLSSKLTSSCKGYVALEYSVKSKKTLQEEIFKSAENANRFYDLNLRQKLADAYDFNIKDFSAYKEGVDFDEINKTWLSLGAAAGTGTLAGILLFVLSKQIHIPVAVVIAGAVLVGLGCGAFTCKEAIPKRNKKQYAESVRKFMSDLKTEVEIWIEGIEKYYDGQVNELKKELKESV